VLVKVLDGIFNAHLKNKNVEKIFKNVKNMARIKSVKNVFSTSMVHYVSFDSDCYDRDRLL